MKREGRCSRVIVSHNDNSKATIMLRFFHTVIPWATLFWWLEDFMNLNQTAVTNAANLAFFMYKGLRDFL